METLTMPVHNLFMELHSMTENMEASRRIGFQNGFFRSRKKRGIVSQYFVFPRAFDSRSVYVGKDSEVLRGVIERFHDGKKEANEFKTETGRISKMLMASGVNHLDSNSFRVIDSFADGGIFRLGGVLIGTNAFNILGNTLGVRWEQNTIQTQDVDFAKNSVKFASLKTTNTIEKFSVPDRIKVLEMGLTPVLSLDFRTPSTSYSNRKGFKVDFLVPLIGRRTETPCFIHDFNFCAKPIQFLDYLIEKTCETTVVSAVGSIKVTVPHPARFAFHKLIVAVNRPVTEESKAVKDIHQAWQLFEVLMERRPDDLQDAFEALTDSTKQRGLGWLKHVRGGLRRMDSQKKEFSKLIREQFSL